MKVQYLNFHNLRNDAQFQCHSEVIDAISKIGAEILKIEDLFAEYVAAFNDVDAALKKANKTIITKQIRDADKARDEIFRGMVDTNRAATLHYDPEVRFAALSLQVLFDNYGNIARKPLYEQTSALHNILQDLAGSHAAHVLKVGLGGWVTELRNRHAAFDNLFKERMEEVVARCDIVLKEARAKLDAIYHKIIKRIHAYVVIEGVENYAYFIKTVNYIVSKFKHGRHHHIDNTEPEGSGEDSPQDYPEGSE